MNAMETRKLAQELGIKNAAKFPKAQLEEMIAGIQTAEALRAEAARLEAEQKAEPAKTKKITQTFAPGSAGKCVDCGRKGDPDSPSDARLCTAHLAEAEHENEHTNGHEGFGGEDENHTNDECWICHPGLNEASLLDMWVPRPGTSRTGMRMTVPVRGAAAEKVAAVEAKLATIDAGFTVATSDDMSLVAMEITAGPVRIILAWDAVSGAYDYDNTQIQREANAKPAKVRNVSAALRALGL